jgi:hypothetical protein
MKVFQPAAYSLGRLLRSDGLYPTIINRAKRREGEVLRDKTYKSLPYLTISELNPFATYYFIRPPNSQIRHLMFPYVLF